MELKGSTGWREHLPGQHRADLEKEPGRTSPEGRWRREQPSREREEQGWRP